MRFRPEHQYLVAINERDQLIGGIYYEIEESFTAAHLEKIVVSEPYRRKGVADGLMREFFNRLRAAGIETVTTGFFRPQYFYAYGFKHVAGPGLRQIVNLADLEGSVFVLNAGQSGNIASPHHADLTDLWLEGEYIPMTMDITGVSNLTLKAKPKG